ncbi:unnamed protein product [Malus baccata var. baccata]
MEGEAEIDRLPIDLLAHIFVLITSFTDLAQASGVCRKWKQAVKQSLGRRECLSFAGWKMDDDSTSRLLRSAYSLRELDIISVAKCISNLTSISLWGITGITDKGVVQLISRANSLHHLNIGGTFITDDSLYAIAHSCPHLKTIILWSCRHVTETGLFVLVKYCRKLESINLWGTRVPVDCFLALITISPALKIKPQGLSLNVDASMLPIV